MAKEHQPIRIAHCSDVHVYRTAYSPAQFLSKQWLGNLNILLNRRYKFHKDPKAELVDLFAEAGVSHVIISGDLTSTSLESEFSAAKQLVDRFADAGMTVHLVPGNHDNYTKQAYAKKLFYRYFGQGSSDSHAPQGHLTLADDGIAIRELGPRWWWVGLDSTIAAGLLRSNGVFSEQIEERLDSLLAQIPEGDHVVMTNHFPLSTTHPSHDMHRVKHLRGLLMRHPIVKLYLHGHIHRQGVTDSRPKGLPILLNSGSCGLKRNATCHMIDLHPNACHVQVYRHIHHQHSTPVERWGLLHEVGFGW